MYGSFCKLSYTLRYREDLGVAITQGDFGFFQTWRKPPTSVAASEQPVPARPPEPDLQARKFTRENVPPRLLEPLRVDPVNLACIDRFCEVAARENIQVLWAAMPTIQASFHGDGPQAAYDALLDDLASRHPNFSVLHRKIETWPDGYFMDAHHLNASGAWKFSRQLGRELATWMSAHAEAAPGSISSR